MVVSLFTFLSMLLFLLMMKNVGTRNEIFHLKLIIKPAKSIFFGSLFHLPSKLSHPHFQACCLLSPSVAFILICTSTIFFILSRRHTHHHQRFFLSSVRIIIFLTPPSAHQHHLPLAVFARPSPAHICILSPFSLGFNHHLLLHSIISICISLITSIICFFLVWSPSVECHRASPSPSPREDSSSSLP